jgi:hypothetical protein
MNNSNNNTINTGKPDISTMGKGIDMSQNLAHMSRFPRILEDDEIIETPTDSISTCSDNGNSTNSEVTSADESNSDKSSHSRTWYEYFTWK